MVKARASERCERSRGSTKSMLNRRSTPVGAEINEPSGRQFLIPNSYLLFPTCFHHASYAEQHEGDAEELAHVEGHAYLEVALHLLAELHEEAEGEDAGEAVAEEEAGAYLAGHAAVEPPADEAEEGVGDSFVELGGVARQHVDLCEDEAPVASCGAADDFGVHEVAQTDAAGGDGGGNGDVVEYGPQGYLVLAHIEPQGDHESEGAAMAGKALVADEAYAGAGEADGQQHLDEAGEIVEVVLRLVEEAVAYAGSRKDADEAVEEEGLEEGVLDLLLFIEALHEEVGACEAYHPEQCIETYRAYADGGIPGNHVFYTLNRKCMMSPS